MTKKRMAALAAIVLFAATGAEAQTGAEIQFEEWVIEVGTDVWGDPNGDNRLYHVTDIPAFRTVKSEPPHGKTPINEAVLATLMVDCDRSASILFVDRTHFPNLEVDWEKRLGTTGKELNYYKVPIKIDGEKGETILIGLGNEKVMVLLFQENPSKITEVQESLEILFAWGEDGQRQSFIWSMDGLSEAFAEACGEELDAGEE